VSVGLAVAGVAAAGCSGSGGGNASRSSSAPCSILAELAQTGETVASANVSDPAAFDKTLAAAVGRYVQTAQRLREAVPERLRPQVTLMIAAVERRDFTGATAARAKIDAYANANCKT
jgi:hypothetical protein